VSQLEPVHSAEVVAIRGRVFRKAIPAEHQRSLDTRIAWLWNQKFGTVQMIYSDTDDLLDRTAATLIIQAIMARDLVAIKQIFHRLEGGAQFDDELLDDDSSTLSI
jgi:hypothetical protein